MEIVDVNVYWGFYPYALMDTSPQKVASLLQEAKITKALSLSLKAIYLSYREGNKETMAICRSNPLFLPIASIDPRDYPRCMEEMERIKENGFSALRLFKRFGKEGQVLKEILRKASSLSLPLMADFAPPLDSIESLPFLLLLELSPDEIGEGRLLAERNNVYFGVNSSFLPWMMNNISPSKLLFASGCPFSDPVVSLRLLEERFPQEEERRAMFEANAKRLFAIS